MHELIERSYQSIIKRGKITDKTTLKDFMDKIKEESLELDYEFAKSSNGKNLNQEFWLEMMDMVNACFCCMKHNEIDIEDLLKQIIQKNETRKD